MENLKVGEFEKIASGVYLEGLAIDEARGAIWYSDVIAGGIHGVMADGSTMSFNTNRQWTGGVLMNGDGAVLSSGPGGIMWNQPDSGTSGWLLREIEGKPINGINEMVPDGTGGIFFGSNDIENVILSRPTRPTALYRLTTKGEVIKLAEGINFSNGIMLSADRKHFYCNDTFIGTWAFDVAEDFSLSNRRMLIEKVDADGMALDADGHLWITGFRSSSIARLLPDGTSMPGIDTPAGAITQVRFGGEDMRSFYINTVPADGGDSLKDGVPLSANNSIMYRGRSSSPGMADCPCRIRSHVSGRPNLIAVVTGASRGAGRGIATALGSHGCTVYVTGRTETTTDSALPGTIYETAEAVTAAGGKGIAVRVDHGDGDEWTNCHRCRDCDQVLP